MKSGVFATYGKEMTTYQFYCHLWSHKDDFIYLHVGEDMYEVIPKGTKELYLLNARTCRAWKLRSNHGVLLLWNKENIDYISLRGKANTTNAFGIYPRAPYELFVGPFFNNRSVIAWLLYPYRGSVYKEDIERNPIQRLGCIRGLYMYAVIDNECNLLTPFSAISEDEAITLAYGDNIPEVLKSPSEKVQISEPKYVDVVVNKIWV